jgi:nitronate monooxygenase
MMTPDRTRHLLELLGIGLPIIQAPMAGVSSPAMAAAVTEAGGLGSIAVGHLRAPDARATIAELRARSPGPFNVNLFCHRPALPNPQAEAAWIERFRPEFERLGASPPPALSEIYRSFLENDEMLAMLLEERPAIVSFHFGLPGEAAVRALRETGIVLLASATSRAEARAVAAAGVHALVAQGWEAGGHRGAFDPYGPDDQLGTMALTPLLVRALDLPVIAAGGIMDGAGIAAALKLGASAAQLGTAFIDTDESLADHAYRALLTSEAAMHTTMTRAISGRPARSLPSDFTRLGSDIPAHEIPAYPVAYDLGKAIHAAAKRRGDFGFGAYWAGQGAPLARALPAGRLVEKLAAELRQAP